MKEYIIGKNEESKRIDKFLKTILPKAPDSFIYKMLRKKNIKLNGSKAEGSEKLKNGDIVSVYFSDETFENFGGKQSGNNNSDNEYIKAYKSLKNITIEYEDDDILIMNKPFNLLSQKSVPSDISLNEWMIGYLLHSKAITSSQLETFKPSVMNRLDRNTRGLVIGAKSLKASQVISSLLKERRIHKYYRAVVIGAFENEVLLKGYWSKDEENNIVKIYDKRPDGIKVELIETRVIPLKKYEERTVVEIELITGKSHQIRAHLASIGFPLLGDPKYGDPKMNRKYNTNGQKLMAVRIEFPNDCEIEQLKGLVVKI